MNKVRKTFSLEGETISKIMEIAKSEKRTLSSVVDIAINKYHKDKKK